MQYIHNMVEMSIDKNNKWAIVIAISLIIILPTISIYNIYFREYGPAYEPGIVCVKFYPNVTENSSVDIITSYNLTIRDIYLGYEIINGTRIEMLQATVHVPMGEEEPYAVLLTQHSMIEWAVVDDYVY